MELRQRKRINNTLPKFDDGADFLNYYYQQHPIFPIYPGVNTPNYGPDDLIGTSGESLSQTLAPSVLGGVDLQKQASQVSIPNNQTKQPNTSTTSAGQKAASVVGGIVNLAQGYLGQQSAVKSTEELMANAGTQNRSIGGIGYVRQNYANDSEILSNLDKSGLSSTIGGVASGASAGAAFGPIGAGVGAVVGGITGLFGWGKSKSAQRKRLNNARQLTSRINTGNQAGAMTTALQQDYYSQYGNTNGGVLYANKGKDIGII